MTTDMKSMTVEELRHLVLSGAVNIVDAYYEILRRLEEAQQKIVAQEADVRNILNRIPASVNGEMIIDHYDIEGEFIGSESVDTLAVLGSVVGALEAMDFSALTAHDAELTANAKAEALEEFMLQFGDEDCPPRLVDDALAKAAEYRAKAGRKE